MLAIILWAAAGVVLILFSMCGGAAPIEYLTSRERVGFFALMTSSLLGGAFCIGWSLVALIHLVKGSI